MSPFFFRVEVVVVVAREDVVRVTFVYATGRVAETTKLAQEHYAAAKPHLARVRQGEAHH
jgi:hypothetical protein